MVLSKTQAGRIRFVGGSHDGLGGCVGFCKGRNGTHQNFRHNSVKQAVMRILTIFVPLKIIRVKLGSTRDNIPQKAQQIGTYGNC